MGDGGGVVAMSAWCECMGGTRGSENLSSSDDVLEMCVVRGVRGVCGVCESCMCLAWGGVGGVGNGFGLFQSCRNRGGGVCVWGM